MPVFSEAVRAHAGSRPGTRAGDMRLTVDRLGDLFESLDPAPHPERDLDPHAEQFLVSWAEDIAHDLPLRLTVHVTQWPLEPGTSTQVEQAVRHHFQELERQMRQQIRALLREGRMALAIGAGFLVLCVTAGNALAELLQGTAWSDIVRETFSIGGWVAMWRPMQIYLYDWWPLKSRQRLYRRMSRMTVRLRPSRRQVSAAAGPARVAANVTTH
jgi:hypothetical protein